MGDGGGGHWLVLMEWHPAGWSVCLKVQKFSGTGSPGWSRKKAIKRGCVSLRVEKCTINNPLAIEMQKLYRCHDRRSKQWTWCQQREYFDYNVTEDFQHGCQHGCRHSSLTEECSYSSQGGNKTCVRRLQPAHQQILEQQLNHQCHERYDKEPIQK